MATADRKPYSLKGQPARAPNGQFARDVPPNPLDETGQQPQRWAPGIGQNTAPVRGPTIPWPKVTRADTLKPT